MHKKCSKCGVVKNVSEFSKMKNSPMGVRPDCKECKYAKDKIWRENNIDILKQKSRDRQDKITLEIKQKKELELKNLILKYEGLKLGDNIYIIKYIGYIKE